MEFFGSLERDGRLTRKEATSALRQVRLPAEAIHRRVSQFSKGMRQKVGIAIALVQEAPAVLLDEPTSGLDPTAASEFLDLLEGLRGEGAAVLMATHDVFRARRICDRVDILRDGKLAVSLDQAELETVDLERLYLDVMRSEPVTA